jgi:hypothetical protein
LTFGIEHRAISNTLIFRSTDLVIIQAITHMSILPEPIQKRKLNISMMLNVPIDIEIEVLELPPKNHYQADDKNEDTIFGNIIKDFEPKVVINGASLAELDQNSQTLVSQFVEQLGQTDSFLSMLSQTQGEPKIQDKLQPDVAQNNEYLETVSTKDFTAISSEISPHNNKNMFRLLDSFNDSFAFIANTVGTVLFLGKIVNYSWD